MLTRILAMGLLGFANSAFANENMTFQSQMDTKEVIADFFRQRVDERYGLSGKAQVRSRYQENNAGDITHRRAQYAVIINGFVNITQNGCLKARGQVATGPGLSSYWENTGLGDAEGKFNINIRQLYLDMTCYLENVRLQVGHLAPHTPGALGLKEDGWVDGARAIITVNPEKGFSVSLTYGHVDANDPVSVFRRHFRDMNYVQFALQTRLGKRVTFLTDLTQHDSNEYLRAALEMATDDIVGFLDGFSVEELLANGEQKGVFVSGFKQIKKWEVRVAFSDIEPDLRKPDTLALPIEDFYGEGDSRHVHFKRDLPKNWTFKMRFREGDSGSRHELRMERKF